MYKEVDVLPIPAWVVVIPIKLLLLLTANTVWPSSSEKELPNPTEWETLNADPIPLLYFNFCPVNSPWLGIEIRLDALLPGCPLCGGIRGLVPPIPASPPSSDRIVPLFALTLTTCIFPVPIGLGTVTKIVPIPMVSCGLNTISLFFWILKLVFIPIENVNLLWSIETLSPSEKYVLTPLFLKIL